MNQPQGSVLGPILRYVYINDLQLVPELTTYADDSTLSINYNKESEAVMARMNNTLEPIAAWGKQWHTRFATEKNQALVISRSSGAMIGTDGKTILGNGVT